MEHVDGGPVAALDAASLNPAQKELRHKTHQTIGKIGDDIGRRSSFNTAVAAAMELLNAVNRFDDTSEQGRAVEHEALEAVVVMLSPMTPHVCHALWGALGHETALVDEPWPEADESALELDTIELVVQVNGKLRGRVAVPADASKEIIEQAALTDDNVQRFVGDSAVRKIIVVPGRLVNIVV